MSLNMKLKYIIPLFVCLYCLFAMCDAEKITYINTERPLITYYNKKYLPVVTITSRRKGRDDPQYYVHLRFEALFVIDNKTKYDFYFYEYVATNRYRRSFLELHYKMCDLIEKDMIFGAAIRKNLKKKTCPYPPGVYDLSNMTMNMPVVPSGFPFTRGRIYLNISLELNGTDISVLRGHIEMELKTINVNKKNTGR